jgi:hypothetical protein
MARIAVATLDTNMWSALIAIFTSLVNPGSLSQKLVPLIHVK